VDVTITSSTQKVIINTSKAMGTTMPAGANGLRIYTGYAQGANAPTLIGNGMWFLSCAPNTRQTYSINGDRPTVLMALSPD